MVNPGVEMRVVVDVALRYHAPPVVCDINTLNTSKQIRVNTYTVSCQSSCASTQSSFTETLYVIKQKTSVLCARNNYLTARQSKLMEVNTSTRRRSLNCPGFHPVQYYVMISP